MFNKVVLLGRIVRDPELRVTNTGTKITNFTLGVDKYNPNDKNAADYPDCVCWNKVAENVEKYCSKGSLVLVEGSVQTSSYEQNGVKRKDTKILCTAVKFIDTKGKKQSETNKPSRQEINEMFDVQFDSFDVKEDDLAF